MASKQNKTQQRQKKGNIKVQQQEIKLENMELNSKEVEHPMNFYLSSLEEQVRCDLKDSEAKITPTKSEGRVLLEIHEDCLQQFLDHLQEKNEGDMQKEICGLKAQLHEAQQGQSPSRDIEFGKSQLEKTNIKLQNAQSDLEEQTSINNEQQVKLEQLMREKEALQNEVEAKKKELCAGMQIITDGKTKREMELESYLENEKAQRKKFNIELKKMSEALKSQEEAAKQEMERYQTFHQTQMDEQRSETNRIAAALKEAQDMPQTEAHSQKKAEIRETFENFCQAKLDEQIQLNNTLKAALDKAEQDLKTFNLQWQHEKVHLTTRLQRDHGYFQCQVQYMAVVRAQEVNAVKQMLERVHGIHQIQMDEQRSETNRIAAALKEAQDMLQTAAHSQQKAITVEDMETFKNFCQAELDQQIHLNNTLKTALEKAEQKLKNETLRWDEEKSSFKEQAEATLETQENDNKNLMAALKKEFEDQLESEHFLWQQEKASLQKDVLRKKSSFQIQLVHQQKKNNSLLAAVMKAEQLLKRRTIEWQKEKSSLDHTHLKNTASLRTQEEEATQMLERTQASHQVQLEDQTAETNRIAAALKETQDMLQTEAHSQQKAITEEDMETFKAKLDQQIHLNNTLKTALDKAEQDLKNETLRWDKEKSSFKEQQEKSWNNCHAHRKTIVSLQTVEKKAKQTLLICKAAHQKQLKEQQAETTKTLLALKNTEDLLEAERRRCQELSSLTAQLETSQSNCLAKLEMQENDNKNLMAALKKEFEDQLESERLLWQQEKDCFGVQLDHHKEENNSLLAAVTQTEQLLKRRTIEWQQEKSSLDHTHLKITASLRTQEEEATQTLKRTQASLQVQLEDQIAETNRIAAALKNTADLLELEHLCCQELSSLTTLLETSQSKCLAKLEMQENDNKNLIASLKNRFEDQLESERLHNGAHC